MNTIKLHGTIRFIYIEDIYISRKNETFITINFEDPRRKLKFLNPDSCTWRTDSCTWDVCTDHRKQLNKFLAYKSFLCIF